MLEYSIRKHASCDVAIHWMRAGDPGFEISPTGKDGSWRINREPGQAWPKHGWGTDFSNFRLAIAELAGFEGVHIYMDADMLVLGDVAELLDLPRRAPWLTLSALRTDVSVIDAAGMRGRLPSLARLKADGIPLHVYRGQLEKSGTFDPSLPVVWNWTDDKGKPIGGAKLLHFTVVPTQPWRPYASVQYQPHPLADWVTLWNRYEEESRARVGV